MGRHAPAVSSAPIDVGRQHLRRRGVGTYSRIDHLLHQMDRDVAGAGDLLQVGWAPPTNWRWD